METPCKYKIIFKDGQEGIEIPSTSSTFTEADFINAINEKIKSDPEFEYEFRKRLDSTKNKRYISTLNIPNIVGTKSLNEIIRNSAHNDKHPTAILINDALITLRDFIVKNSPEDNKFNPNHNTIIYTDIRNNAEDPDLYAGAYDPVNQKIIVNRTTKLKYNNISLIKNLIDYAVDLLNLDNKEVKEAIRLLPNTVKKDNGIKDSALLQTLSDLLNISKEVLEVIYTSHLDIIEPSIIEKYTGKTNDDLKSFYNIVANKFGPLVESKSAYYTKTQMLKESDGFKLDELLSPGMIITVPNPNPNDKIKEIDLVYALHYTTDKDIYVLINTKADNKRFYYKKQDLQHKDKISGEITYKVKYPVSTDVIDLGRFNYDDNIEKGANVVIINKETTNYNNLTKDYQNVVKSLNRGDYFMVETGNHKIIYKVFERNGDNIIYGNRSKKVYSTELSTLKPLKIIKYLDNITEDYESDKFNFNQNLYPITEAEAKPNDVVRVVLTDKQGNVKLDENGKEYLMTNLLVGVGESEVTILTKDKLQETEQGLGFGIKVNKANVKNYYRNYNIFKDSLNSLVNYKDGENNLSKLKNYIIDFKANKRISSDIHIHLIDTSSKNKSKFVKNKLLNLKVGDIVEVKDDLWVISEKELVNGENKLELIRYNVSQVIINNKPYNKKNIVKLDANLSDIQTIIGNSNHVYFDTIKQINQPLIVDQEVIQGESIKYKKMYLVTEGDNNISSAVWKDETYFDQKFLELGLLKRGDVTFKNFTELYRKANNLGEIKAPFATSKLGNSVGLKNILGYVSKNLKNVKLDDVKNKFKSGTYISFWNDFKIYRIEEVTEDGLVLAYSNNNNNGTTLNLTRFRTWDEINTKNPSENSEHDIQMYYIPHTSAFVLNDFSEIGQSIYNENSFKVKADTSDSFTIMSTLKKNLKKMYNIDVIEFNNDEDFRKKYKIPENLAAGAKAFAYNGKIFISDNSSIDDVAHEFMHLLLGSLKWNNFELYQKIVSLKLPKKYTEDFERDFGDVYAGLTGLERKEEIFVRAFGEQVMKISNINEILDNPELDSALLGLISQFLGLVDVPVGLSVDLYSKSLKDLINENGSGLLNPESLYDKDASINGLKLANLKEQLEIKCD